VTAPLALAHDVSGPWTIGVVRHGNGPEPRSDEPTYWLTEIRTYDDGLTERHSSPYHYGTADEAQRDRIRRLRECGTPFTQGPGWIEFRDDSPCHVEPSHMRLEYSTDRPVKP
jgi:hypothetical protein